MKHHKIIFSDIISDTQELIIALLQEVPALTGYEQTDNSLIAYFENEGYDEDEIKQIAQNINVSFISELLEERNWNAEWERNFDPVLINNFCYIRADFHQPKENIQHEIIITPKMSFGTGHHATTQMMVTLMKDIQMKGTRVLDYGTGTGVLAILAEQLGAAEIVGVDIDTWSFENAQENCHRNNTKNISLLLGDLNVVEKRPYDVILANINRHILLSNMPQLSELLNPSGTLLLSGILANDDVDIIKSCTSNCGLKTKKIITQDKWAAIMLSYV